jgi:hypothetical protein
VLGSNASLSDRPCRTDLFSAISRAVTAKMTSRQQHRKEKAVLLYSFCAVFDRPA